MRDRPPPDPIARMAAWRRVCPLRRRHAGDVEFRALWREQGPAMTGVLLEMESSEIATRARQLGLISGRKMR